MRSALLGGTLALSACVDAALDEDLGSDTEGTAGCAGGKCDHAGGSDHYEVDRLRLPRAGDTVLAETHPEIMSQLEGDYSLGALFSRRDWGVAKRRADNLEFANASPSYASMVGYLEQEIVEIGSKGQYTYGADPYVNRLFNHRWLKSPYAHYELAAVVNRIDRMDFQGGTGCGELRFVYRLAYDKTDLSPPVSSRLPFTVNVVYEVLGDPGQTGWQGCTEQARAWQPDRDLGSASEYADWLAAVADIDDESRYRFAQVEVNFQVVRIPSESKDDLGGHAEYLLRILRPSADDPKRLEPAYLENTPDVDRIRRSPELQRDLIAFIEDNADAIDRGVVQFPEKFLTREVTSFSTHGIHRKANRPFSRLLSPADLAGVDFSSTRQAKSAEALLIRLDDLTCSGCHQRESVAGFHMLGHDRPDTTHPLNALRLASSAHFDHELDRRRSYMWNLTRDARPDGFRPLSFQPHKNQPAKAGGKCFVASDASRHFKESWSCEAGLECRTIAQTALDPDIGVCVRPANQSVGGDPCLEGSFAESSADPRSDRMSTSRFGCGAYACLPPEEGTPAGLCYANCGPGNTARNSDEICAYNGGASFDSCAASGNFASCLDSSISRGLRTACDDDTPCRDDYICQRYFDIRSDGIVARADGRGFCVPTYFLYQIRLDGHPPNPL